MSCRGRLVAIALDCYELWFIRDRLWLTKILCPKGRAGSNRFKNFRKSRPRRFYFLIGRARENLPSKSIFPQRNTIKGLIIMNIKAEFPIFEYANKYDLCFKSRTA